MPTIAAAERRPGANLPPTETLKALYHQMLRVRRFDERVIDLFRAGVIKGTAHSCVGQEAIAVGACAHLAREDFIVSHHRGHGHCIAKGASPDRMMAELMGRVDGYCRGLGGSMHIADLDARILGANGIVGAGIGIGNGAALKAQLDRSGHVGVVFFGDGATNEGIFHEALNLASLWKLPVVFVCENNQYGMSTTMAESTAVDRIAKRAAAYAMPGETIDGNDLLAVHDAVGRAAARARAGGGPTLIEALTYRWGDHSMRGNLPRYRQEDEEQSWKARDPIARLGALLTGELGVAPDELAKVEDEVRHELDLASSWAQGRREPTEAEMEASVYAPHYAPPPEPASPGTRELTMVEAINEAMAQEMARDGRVIVLGLDIGKIGGIFGCTRGLRDRFGAERVRDAPISEAAYSNLAMGAAVSGLRPIVEVQIFDFVTHMMDMIVNQAAKFRYMLGGKPTVPLVIRGPQGGGVRLAAQHSQSLEAWFTHVPGLVVMAPSTPYDAKGLLTTAMRDDNPVIFLEHKLLYLGAKGPVPEPSYAIAIGKADIKRPGRDVTVVAIQAMVAKALQAAVELAREGIEIEVVDPRTLVPLDEDTILASVRRTNRCLVVHEAWKRGGYGAEIAATIAEKAFDWLDAPVARLGARDVPMPYNDVLERAVIPQAEDIAAAVRALVGAAGSGARQ